MAATDFSEKGGEVQGDVWELTLGLTSATLTRMETIINWLKTYEFIAIWLEGIALVAIFALDWLEYRMQGQERLRQEQDRIEQHTETAAQMDIWRSHIHAARVAEIFSALRAFGIF